MTTASPAISPVDAQLRAILARRIMILDGAMGTIIQQYKLDEQAYRFNTRRQNDGERFSGVTKRVTGKRITYKDLIGREQEQTA